MGGLREGCRRGGLGGGSACSQLCRRARSGREASQPGQLWSKFTNAAPRAQARLGAPAAAAGGVRVHAARVFAGVNRGVRAVCCRGFHGASSRRQVRARQRSAAARNPLPSGPGTVEAVDTGAMTPLGGAKCAAGRALGWGGRDWAQHLQQAPCSRPVLLATPAATRGSLMLYEAPSNSTHL